MNENNQNPGYLNPTILNQQYMNQFFQYHYQRNHDYSIPPAIRNEIALNQPTFTELTSSNNHLGQSPDSVQNLPQITSEIASNQSNFTELNRSNNRLEQSPGNIENLPQVASESSNFKKKNGEALAEREKKSSIFDEDSISTLKNEIANLSNPSFKKIYLSVCDFVKDKISSSKKRRIEDLNQEDNDNQQVEKASLKSYDFALGVFLGKLLRDLPELDSKRGCGADWLKEKIINRKRYTPKEITVSFNPIPSFSGPTRLERRVILGNRTNRSRNHNQNSD